MHHDRARSTSAGSADTATEVMTAAVVARYGPPDTVGLRQVPRPTPRSGEVLVRVRAAAVTSADARIRGARFPRGFGAGARLVFGLTRPRRPILGSALSGEVVASGPRVDGIVVGDQVCGMTGLRMGAHAEYVAVPAERLVATPAGVSHEDAAGVLFGGSTAWYFLHEVATVTSATSVLVNGASGAVGTNAVQLAARLGADVTAVTSGANAALVTDLGARTVIDHTRTRLIDVDDRYDVVLDTVGNLSVASGRRLLTRDGMLVLAVAGLNDSARARGNVRAGSAPERVEDVRALLQLVADGELTVVLDDVLGLSDIVRAHRRVDSGHKVGNLIVRS